MNFLYPRERTVHVVGVGRYGQKLFDEGFFPFEILKALGFLCGSDSGFAVAHTVKEIFEAFFVSVRRRDKCRFVVTGSYERGLFGFDFRFTERVELLFEPCDIFARDFGVVAVIGHAFQGCNHILFRRCLRCGAFRVNIVGGRCVF